MDKEYFDTISRVASDVIATTASIYRVDANIKEFDRNHARLREQVKTALCRVRGNRTPSTPITWADVNLSFAATLRTCLQFLEGETE